MQALLHGNYNAFQQDHNKYVYNIFAISPYFPTSPLLNLSILKLLIDRSGDESGTAGYISVEHATQYFVAMGISEPAFDHALSILFERGLIEPYDSTAEKIATGHRIGITHAGRMHFELGCTDRFFVGEMSYATPVRKFDFVELLRSLRAKLQGGVDWRRVQREFFEYCFKEDDAYVRIPKDEIYEGQRNLRTELKLRWIEQREATKHVVATDTSAAARSYVEARVEWYHPAKGFGFVAAGLGENVFFHRNTLQQAGIDEVTEGDYFTCDIAPGPKGKLLVIAIHSLIGKKPAEKSFEGVECEGVVDFYNTKRGYGFIKAEALKDDVYISSRVLQQSGLQDLITGAKVRVGVVRRSRGYLAETIEVLPAEACSA